MANIIIGVGWAAGLIMAGSESADHINFIGLAIFTLASLLGGLLWVK